MDGRRAGAPVLTRVREEARDNRGYDESFLYHLGYCDGVRKTHDSVALACGWQEFVVLIIMVDAYPGIESCGM